MQWIAQSAKDTVSETLGKRLWETDDQFRANSGLNPHDATGRFVLANPLFSVNALDNSMLDEKRRAGTFDQRAGFLILTPSGLIPEQTQSSHVV